MPVKQLRNNGTTTVSVFLIWGQPDEYRSDYTYRVQTASPLSVVIDQRTASNQLNVTNLSPGVTYTFTVFTRAADNVTESQAVSYTTCTVPGLAQNITVNNKNTTNSLSVNWTIPAGKVDYFIVILSGDVNRTFTTNSTQVDFTELLPGRNYSITIQTVSSNCSQSAALVIEATYPASPGSLNFTNIGTNTISLSLGEPVNMTNVTKTFKITYSNSLSSWTVSVNTLNATLQNLTSGTNYTITVVTVVARQYQSSPVTSSIYTKPMPVKQLRNNGTTTVSVFLIWGQPDEYISDYTYRVQTASPLSVVIDQRMASNQLNVTNLTPGVTYTFTVFTRAADNVTESQAVSYTTCTVPGLAQNITVNNKNTTNSLSVNWTIPAGKVDYFTVILSGDVNRTFTTNSTQVDFTELLPGRNYSITIQTVSSNCSQSAALVIEATYPASPGSLNFTNIGTNTISLSLGEPVNMANVTKTFKITYSNSLSSWTVSVNTLNATLQNLTSGTNYTITVVTVGARQYQSSPVTSSIYTIPGLAQNITVNNKNTTNSLSVNWTIPAGKVDYFIVILSGDVNRTFTTNSTQVDFTELLPGRNYSITIQTVSSNCSQSAALVIEATYPASPGSLNFTNIGTNTISLSLGEPVNMTNVTKTFKITYSNSLSSWTVSVNTLNATLQNLTSGTNYTITVVTVVARQYQSSPVTSSIYTKPMPVKQLRNNGTTTVSVFLIWGQPDEYISDYTYRVQTASPLSVVIDQRMASNQLNVTNLTPGVTYTFTVFTRAADNVTESQAVSYTTCTVPGLAQNITVNNKNTTNSLSVNWTIPAGKVDYFTVILSGDVNRTFTTNSTQVDFTELLPGRNYSITIQTVSSNCSQSAALVIEATYPASPGSLNFTNIGTNTISLSLGEPVNMTNVTKTFKITYSNSLSSWTVSVNTLNATLQNLTSGTNYTITVVTVGARQYQSSPVTSSIYTIPGLAQNITVNNKNTTNSLSVNWTIPAGKVDNYTVILSGDVNRTFTTNSTQVDFTELLPGRNYSITIQTVSSNCSQSAALVIEATYPASPGSLNFTNIGTNTISLSLGEPVNMANVTKTFKITYSNSLSSWTVSVNTLNATLQNLTSGTNYTITVVTVGARQYQSSPVTSSIYTKPMPVKQLRNNGTTTVSVFLIWGQPDEYISDYTYRVQTASPLSVVIDQRMASNQLNVTNLTPGVTYTFTVFTRAADNVTESQAVSYTTCTVPGLAQNITVNNKNTTNSLSVNWTIPAGKVDNYTVILSGDVNRTFTTNSTQVDFTELLPGRNYSITIQTVSSNCSQSAALVIEATYPASPGSLNFTNIGTNTISLSLGEPVNMTNVTKTFKITYSNSLSSWTVSVNTLNATLQNLTSGTNYTITVVTVGARQYQSSPVTSSIYTKPMPVKQLRNNGTTTVSVFLIWGQPDEYRSDYTYRVQTASPLSVVIDQRTASNQLNVTNLTPGVTYTFTVFTRAADNVTESQAVSYTTCTVPGLAQNITVNNKNTTNSLSVNWTIPAGKVDYFIVILSGDVNRTFTTNSTQVDFTELLPGRNYSITIQTVSSNCSQSAALVIEATYPASPGSLNFTNIGTNTISLSLGEPVNMTNVTKTFKITYSNSLSSWTVSVNTLNATLQNLTSGTNYTITVVTVGARQYQSSPVTSSIYTKPMPVKQLRNNGTTTVSVFLIWGQPDEYRSDYTYRVQTASPLSVVIDQRTASNQLNVTNLTPGVTYTFTVFTRAADNVTESQAVSYTTCTVPGLAQNITVNNKDTTNSLSVNWTIPAGKVDYFTVILSGDVNRTFTTNSTQVDFTELLPGRNYSITIQTVSSNCSQSAAPVIEATYPASPGSLNFTNIGTNTISLSLGEPVNMTNVTKTFKITYSNSLSSWTVSVNTLNATLQNLTSGTNYTITVVTVGARQYQSSPVTSSIYTKPMPVKQLRNNGTTTVSVFLIWGQPDEYRSDYTYRVQTASPLSVVIDQRTASNQLNVTNLTPGVTYTFTVFTRAADNVTESQAVSYTTCTVPGLAQNITVNNKDTTNSLSVNWTIPAGKVDYFTVILSGDVNRTFTTNSTQVDFTELLPGRNYSITIQTVSSNCSQSAAPVIEATYPASPGSLNFTNIGTNTISLSLGEPVNMTNVTKTFKITYSNSLSSWTVSVNTLNATLQNLTSGTNYTITVVTVGARQYQSSPVTSSIYTKPMPVKQLRNNRTTTLSVFLIWGQPDEYRSDYTYRVQTASPLSVVIDQRTASNQLNVTNLTPGVTYTFTVFTRAADNVTESQAVSYTTCTVPGLAQNITVNNKDTTNSLSVNWTIPAGKVDYFTVILSGDVNRTFTTNSTQVDFTELLPGRNYSITIQTVSSNCSQSAAPVIEATYPASPGSLNFTNIGTNTISLSLGEPVNMTNVTKTFKITYSNSLSSWTVSVNTLNATLQNLTSGTNYTITVVTVVARQYQSSPVTSSIYTKPMPVKQLGNNGTTTVSVFLIWNQPDEYRSDYTHRVQTASPFICSDIKERHQINPM
ncbi:titin isoform X1 [Pelobates cultripes]|uniref:Titin isoform X1 n=1 Tax=Pelobates cultripes TaxID=61616 RepID=A0AAD1WGE3_PELCU|nr:titin isoform X1 [Pelobates cultripes]